MHPGAFEFIGRYATAESIRVIEIGSRDINGSARPHFPAAEWIGIDLYPGPSVDVVADARQYQPDQRANLVICAEVFEHVQHWRELVQAAWRMLIPGGLFLATCGGPGRDPHSGIDGGTVRPAEWYCNLTPADVAAGMERHGFSARVIESNEHWRDVYCEATKANLPEH